jgi:hypothetical protein
MARPSKQIRTKSNGPQGATSRFYLLAISFPPRVLLYHLQSFETILSVLGTACSDFFWSNREYMFRQRVNTLKQSGMRHTSSVTQIDLESPVAFDFRHHD